MILKLNGDEAEGKKAKKIYCGSDGDCVQIAKNDPTFIKEIILSKDYHGEYDLIWFVILENGKEVSRINAKYVQIIEWEA